MSLESPFFKPGGMLLVRKIGLLGRLLYNPISRAARKDYSQLFTSIEG